MLCILVGLAFPLAARADEADQVFDPSGVALIDLTLSDAAQDALAADPGEYVDGTLSLKFGDLSYGPETVEVRLKGHATFRPLGKKSAFKLKFPKANRLLGLKSMTLNNMVQDESMIHETLGYEILRAADIPAARTGFAYVRVNGKRYGLYLELETYDDISMKRLFDSTQHLYEADDYGVDVVPGGASAYQVEEGDEDDISDLEALIGATNATGGDWSDGMAATADLDEMTRMWAGEQFIGHWDGYSVRAGSFWPNNYYLHSDDSGRFSMLPSGLDWTFVFDDPFPGAGDGVLSVNCRADSSCLAAFRDRLGDVAAAADAMHVGARLNAIAATVARWRPCADLERATDPQWQTAVTGTRAFVRDRRDAVASYRGTAQPARDPLLDSTTPPALSSAGCPLDPPPAVKPEDPKPTPKPATQTTTAATPAIAVAGATAARVRPRRLTAHTRSRRARRLTAWGSLLLPNDVGQAGTCGGRVTVRVKAGGRTIAQRRVRVRFDCTYVATFTFKKPERRTLTVQARFEGTAKLLPARAVATRPRA